MQLSQVIRISSWNWRPTLIMALISLSMRVSLATVGYTFGESRLFTLTAGYRYMSIEIKGMTARGNPSAADIDMSGPLLGFVFSF